MSFTSILLALAGAFSPPLLRAEPVPPASSFHADADLDLAALERAVSARAPELAAARREVLLAQGEARQARLLDNPELSLAWSTIPLGTTNPRDLPRPLANVPSYEVALGYRFPIAKRAPRRERADAYHAAAQATFELAARTQALSLAETLGKLASATLKREGVQALVEGGRHAAALAEARLKATFGTPLDVDQIRIEVARTEQLLAGVNADIAQALADCAGLVGAPCESFADEGAARTFLTRWIERGADRRRDGPLERADLRALSALGRAASAELKLGHAQRIPDPAVRLGYLHDRFIVSGNQRNSLGLAVSLPLPMFDRGQERVRTAAAVRGALLEEKQRRIAAAKARIPALERRLALSSRRCTELDAQIIPEALQVLSNLEQAAENRLLPLTQVIQSRRVVSELLIEAAESCGEAYHAALELERERPRKGTFP